ncbi:MAG: hypothetical protein WCA27_26365 [Candidatus Sulfotelmatobacter sp.]
MTEQHKALATNAQPTDPDGRKYCDLMEEVKLRMSVIKFFLSGKGHALYQPPTLESVTLQLRKVLELIAFSSLIANKEAYSAVYSKVSKAWNAGDLLAELEQVNPNFYPVPVIQKQNKETGAWEHAARVSDYLTKTDFKEVYGRCGVMAHAANPFGKGIDYAYYQAKLPLWRAQIINLLNMHEIVLAGSTAVYVVFMTVHGSDRVHWNKLEPMKKPPDGCC